MSKQLRLAALAMLATCATIPAQAQRNEAADRAAIHALLTAYGSTLDAHDFEGFGRLFGKSGRYVTGGREAKGPEAADNMRKVFAANPMGLPDPKFHIFFNEVVTFDGPDTAQATSMSFYVAPDERNRPAPVLMARYEDRLVREDGRWVFARRIVSSLIPAPRPAQ